MSARTFRTLLITCLVALAVAGLVFSLWPRIDLTVSGWFFDPGQGFWIAEITAIQWLRETIKALMHIIPLVTLLMLILSGVGLTAMGVPARLWGYVTTLFIIGPGLLAAVILKENWGRARPGSVEAFGGTKTFTPALLPTDQCESNCSFVSGEGSGATAMAIAMILLAPYLLRAFPVRARALILGAALLVPLTATVLRVAMGRHFLSDTVFAVLLVATVALILLRLFQLPNFQKKTGVH